MSQWSGFTKSLWLFCGQLAVNRRMSVHISSEPRGWQLIFVGRMPLGSGSELAATLTTTPSRPRAGPPATTWLPRWMSDLWGAFLQLNPGLGLGLSGGRCPACSERTDRHTEPRALRFLLVFSGFAYGEMVRQLSRAWYEMLSTKDSTCPSWKETVKQKVEKKVEMTVQEPHKEVSK